MLKVKRLHENAILPTRAHPTDAGLDLYACRHNRIAPGEIFTVRTGLAFEVQDGYEVQIRPRSGLTAKGIVVILGTVDAGYRGEVMVTLLNVTQENYDIFIGDRIAQAVIAKVELWEPVECWELSASDRGAKGHGSSGV